MTMENIIEQHEQLERQLRIALATMERKDTIAEIRHEILKNQEMCPHFSNKYNWVVTDNYCPYCGKKM